MLPGLERLKVGHLSGEEDDDAREETLTRVLLQGGVVFGAFGTSGVVNPDSTHGIKSEFALLKANLVAAGAQYGSFNKGVPVYNVRPIVDSWLQPQAFGISEDDYRGAYKIFRVNGVFYRWTLKMRNGQATRQELVAEAYTMIEAALYGFGPSIYAAYITTLPYPCLHVVMDSGTPLTSYIMTMDSTQVDVLVNQLDKKCKLASQTGLLLLDIKPDNIICAKGADGGVVVMLIDFDPRFVVQMSINDEDCMYFLNLFLLVAHLKCTLNPRTTPAAYMVLSKLIDIIDDVYTERRSLCSMMDNIILFTRTTPRRGTGGGDVETLVYDELTEWRHRLEEPTGSMDNYRTVILAFVFRVHHYFVGLDEDGKGKCVEPFDIDMHRGTRDPPPLMDQLRDWIGIV